MLWEQKTVGSMITLPNPLTSPNQYVEWITEAKGEETRKRRLTTAIEWMAKGKSRHWKYVNC